MSDRPTWSGSWPYHADPPQKYTGNYDIYLKRGGSVNIERDVLDFVHEGRNRGDMARFFFFCLVFDQIQKEQLAGDIAEVGVYKGDSASLLVSAARRFGCTAWLFDTFEGFDERDFRNVDSGKKAAFEDTSLESARARLGEQNVNFVKGYFPETTALIPNDLRFALVHIDCDLYQPIKSGLEYFYPRMVPGGFLLVHDYTSLHWVGTEKAVDEFFADKPESIVPLTDGCGTIVVRKNRRPDRYDNWYVKQRAELFQSGWVDASQAGSTHLFLDDGWSQPEDWGVWGIGAAHSLSIYLSPPLSADIELECEVQAVLLGGRMTQEVDVLAGGRLLTTWVFDPAARHGIRRVRIPKELAEQHLPAIPIEFRPRSVATPNELDPSIPDHRALGLGLHRLRVIPA